MESEFHEFTFLQSNTPKKVVMFLYTLALDTLNRKVQERFQLLSKIVSRYFKEVFKIMCLLLIDIVKLGDPEFRNTP
jgi:hypothetical protein